MFTPSLISAMIHSVWRQADLNDLRIIRLSDLADQLKTVSEPRDGWPFVPVIGGPANRVIIDALGLQSKEIGEWRTFSRFWTRARWDNLRTLFTRPAHEIHAEEFLDLGTAIQPLAPVKTVDQTCHDLLKKSAQSTAINVGIVDRGDSVTGNTPDDFGGKLAHTNTTNVVWSGHALEVLSVLLERIERHKGIPQCAFYCGLVTDPSNHIGLDCFDHANAVEMLNELNALSKNLRHSKLPLIVNVSLGTHVGPHNGQSPLEECVSQIASAGNSNEFVVVAAGNDGLSGQMGRIELQANTKDYMRIRTGRTGTTELLVEFWWQEPSSLANADLELEVSIAPLVGQPYATFTIDPLYKGRTLATRFRHKVSTTLLRGSVFRDRCHNDMSCIALMLSTTDKTDLESLHINCGLVSKAPVIVNAWIVVCGDPETAFIGSADIGSIMVPATEKSVLSVAGVDKQGQPWLQSSRGVAGVYAALPTLPSAPHLSHLVDFRGGMSVGTSYAAPRAAGDLAGVLLGNLALSNSSMINVADEILKINSVVPGSWNPRIGRGAVKH